MNYLEVSPYASIDENLKEQRLVSFMGVSGQGSFTYRGDITDENNIVRKGLFQVDVSNINKKTVGKIIELYFFCWNDLFYSDYSQIFMNKKFESYAIRSRTLTLNDMEFFTAWKNLNTKELAVRAKFNCNAPHCCDGVFM